MTVQTEYRDAVLEDIGAAVVSPTGQQVNIGAGTKSIWFALTPRNPTEYVEAALITFQTSVTATGGTASSVSGAAQLDAACQQVFVAQQGSTSPRSYASSRLACQEVERLAFALDDASIAYPGTAIASIASAASTSFTTTLLVPVGGHAAGIQVMTPPASQAWTANAVVLNTVTVRAVSGLNPTVVTFKDDVTNNLGSGAAVDITTYIQDPDIQANWLDFVGAASTGTTLQGVTIIGADGSFLVDFNSGEVATQQNLQKYLGKSNYLVGSTVFNLRRQGVRKAQVNLAAAGTLELLRMEFANGKSLVTPATPAPTVSSPASNQTGVAVAGGQAVVGKSARLGNYGAVRVA